MALKNYPIFYQPPLRLQQWDFKRRFFLSPLLPNSLKRRYLDRGSTPSLRKSHVALDPFELWKYLPYGARRGVLWRAFFLGYSVIVEPAILMHFPWNHYGFTPESSYQSFTNFLLRKIPREIVLLTHKASACFSPVASLFFSLLWCSIFK